MTADYIVLRHGLDVPDEYRAEHLEGLWIDVSSMPTPPPYAPVAAGLAVAEPSGTFETRDDGAVAEVYLIRLTTPNEQREDPIT
jgi:hypothetical protein